MLDQRRSRGKIVWSARTACRIFNKFRRHGALLIRAAGNSRRCRLPPQVLARHTAVPFGWDTRYRLSTEQVATGLSTAPTGRDRRGGYEAARRAAGMYTDGMVSKELGRTRQAFDRLAGALDYLFDTGPDQLFKIDVGVIEEE